MYNSITLIRGLHTKGEIKFSIKRVQSIYLPPSNEGIRRKKSLSLDRLMKVDDIFEVIVGGRYNFY